MKRRGLGGVFRILVAFPVKKPVVFSINEEVREAIMAGGKDADTSIYGV